MTQCYIKTKSDEIFKHIDAPLNSKTDNKFRKEIEFREGLQSNY